jgi:pyruvate kinase
MGKGLNFPDSVLKVTRMPPKDLTDLDWAVAHNLDFLGLSFVQTEADVEAWREAVAQRRSRLRLITKIETPAAVRNIDAIIERSDAILVARGDLGVEVDLVEVPVIQKDIVRRCQAAGVPVIVATQMLQSMVDSPRPTRAEVSDVANAILDGADAVMLSAETAIGKHPTAAVQCMNRIIARTEAAEELAGRPAPRIEQPALRVTSAVARTAVLAAREHGAKAVVVWTQTGNTARLVSKHHVPQPVLAFAPDEHVCRRLALLAGVTAARVDRPADERTLLRTVDRELIRRGWARRSDMVVVVAGTDRTTPGASDSIILHFVEDESASVAP